MARQIAQIDYDVHYCTEKRHIEQQYTHVLQNSKREKSQVVGQNIRTRYEQGEALLRALLSRC